MYFEMPQDVYLVLKQMFEHARPSCIIPILARYIHSERYTEVLCVQTSAGASRPQ